MTRLLARFRVALGFALAAVVLWLATPTWMSLAAGAWVAFCGEGIRVWAAGHLEKSKEITRSGPYRYTRHPLYLGSTLIGLGLAAAVSHAWASALIVVYLAATLSSAIVREEAHLREKFGDAYDAYAERRAEPMDRPFSWARARHNREHHAMAGLAAGLIALAIKIITAG